MTWWSWSAAVSGNYPEYCAELPGGPLLAASISEIRTSAVSSESRRLLPVTEKGRLVYHYTQQSLVFGCVHALTLNREKQEEYGALEDALRDN